MEDEKGKEMERERKEEKERETKQEEDCRNGEEERMKRILVDQGTHKLCVDISSLVPTVQFLITCSMQKWRGKAWSTLSCE